jgi:predicted XRE-type DNA-binding protein
MSIEIHASSGNVFADLGFDEAEALTLAARADLMADMQKAIAKIKPAE